MKTKNSKMKERRWRDELKFVERRRGALWMYAQIPVCATLVACFIRLAQ